MSLIRQTPTMSSEPRPSVLRRFLPPDLFIRPLITTDNLGKHMKTRYVLNPALTRIMSLLKGEALQQRAAYVAIEVLAEGTPGCVHIPGCSLVMQKHLPELFAMLTPGLDSPEPIVRKTCVMTLGQLSEQLIPAIHDAHELVMPLLTRALADPHEDVIEAAIFSVGDYCADFGDRIQPYLEQLIAGVLPVIDNAPVRIQETAFSTVAAIAQSAQHALAPFAEEVLNRCMARMADTDEDMLKCRGRATECASMVLVALPLHSLPPTLEQKLIDLAIDGLGLEMDEAAFCRDACYTFFSNYCTFVGAETIQPYLELLVPFCQASLQSQEGVSVEDNRPAIAQLLDDAPQGDTSITTPYLNEKTSAVQLLGQLAKLFGPTFGPYVPESALSCAPLMAYESDSARIGVLRALRWFVISFHASHGVSKAFLALFLWNLEAPLSWLLFTFPLA